MQSQWTHTRMPSNLLREPLEEEVHLEDVFPTIYHVIFTFFPHFFLTHRFPHLHWRDIFGLNVYESYVALVFFMWPHYINMDQMFHWLCIWRWINCFLPFIFFKGSSVADQINDSPIEEVRLTVPITDDTTLQALTFQTWILGLTTCTFLAFTTRMFDYRQNQTTISSTVVQLFILPLGKLMATVLPTTAIRVFGTKWKFSLNPGPYNVKEHVLISMLIDCGSENPYAADALIISRIYYHRQIRPLAAYLLTQTSQLIGYGYAGIFVKLLVDSPYMWWPSTLADATFYRTLHEAEVRLPNGQLTRMQFFIIVFVCAFTYHLVPNYFFPSISVLSITCWIWKNSVTAQQIGAGRNGLGLGSFILDWWTITWLGSPLVAPAITIHNTMLGFIVFVYMITPLVYWTNSYNAKAFPIISSHLFDEHGQVYNMSRVLDEKSFTFNQKEYDTYSKFYLSAFFAYGYGFTFATVSAALTHVLIFHGREICGLFKKALRNQSGDIHNWMMKKYASVPQWWYHLIAVAMIALSILNSSLFGQQFQFPWWGIVVAYIMAIVMILPIGVITATTNSYPSLYIVGEIIIGYMYLGRPLGNLIFKDFNISIWSHAINFLRSFKLGVYMKIPPRPMFIVQLVGMFCASSVNIVTAWWLLSTIDNICDVTKLPKGSPWTCPGYDFMHDVSLLWGAVGPKNVFAPDGVYSKMYFFFIIGVVATTLHWILLRMFPNKKWIRSFHIPLIVGATTSMPFVRPVSYWSWWVVGCFFNAVVYKRFRGWWAKYTYVLSTALEAGIGVLALLLYFGLQRKDIYGPNWWGLEYDDHCPLAHCPTAPGIQVDGCPVF